MIVLLKKIKYYILMFIIVELVTVFILHKNYTDNKEQYFSKKINELQIAYSAILNGYSKISQTIYNEIINKPGIIEIFKDAYTADETHKAEIRKKLYQKLNPTYQSLKKTDFVHLHFQLPDCSSFLRFHKPDKFGDNLADSRYSVKIANTKKIPVQGFEIGSVYHGYRYIYPLFNNDIHIGSIEIGISFNAIRQEMEKIFPIKFYFILMKKYIKKNLLEYEDTNFIECKYSDEYLIEKITQQNNNINQIDNTNIDLRDKIHCNIQSKINEKLTSNKAFVVFTNIYDKNYIISLIPIKNYKGLVIAYIISYAKDTTLREYRNIFYKEVIVISLLLLIIILFIYYINYSKKIIKKNRDHLQSIADNMSEGLIDLDLSFKVISINPSAEKILGLYNHEIKGRSLENIIEFKNELGKIISIAQWQIFDHINYGLAYKAKHGFFIRKNRKEVPLELSATPRYQETKLEGFLIVFSALWT